MLGLHAADWLDGIGADWLCGDRLGLREPLASLRACLAGRGTPGVWPCGGDAATHRACAHTYVSMPALRELLRTYVAHVGQVVFRVPREQILHLNPESARSVRFSPLSSGSRTEVVGKMRRGIPHAVLTGLDENGTGKNH